jgi:type IV fimbrial biogenesis protein FimT
LKQPLVTSILLAPSNLQRASVMRTKKHDHSRRRSLRARVAACGAFTIVELVIVIMVMGIMAAVAAPTFFESLEYHRVESAARRVKADLELTRHLARLKSTTQSLKFGIADYSLSAGVSGLDDPSQTYAVDLTAAPYELSNVIANFGNSQTVSFDGYGTPSSSGTVVLSSGAHQCTLTLDGVTGEVTITSDHARDDVAALDGA